MKMKKINKNGFTLIEILAVIVIMGILSGLGIVSVRAILNKANEKYYESQKKSMLMATKSYVQDNRNSLPKSIGETKIIYLYNLQKKKYIGEVLDRHNNSCSSDKTEDDSYVKITKTSKTEYSYYVYLACGDVDSSVERTVTVVVSKDDNLSKAKITVTCEGNDNAVASYSYSIYKGNKLIKDSGNIAVKGNKLSYEKDISLEGYEPGSYRIVVTAYDKLGNKRKGENTIEIQNGNLNCQVLSQASNWNKGPVTATAKCSNDKNFECEREVYTQTFTEDGIKGIIQMKDIYGGSKDCSVSIMIDNTPPSKPIVNNPNDGKWAKTNYTIDLTSKDDTSGIASFQYSYNRDAVGTSTSASDNKTKWIIYDNSSGEAGKNITFTTRSFTAERNQPVYFRACDNAGNCSEIASTTIMLDKTAPTCSFSEGNTTWKKGSHSITATCSDSLSGCTSDTASNTFTESSGTVSTKSISYTINDNAGNSATCSETGSFYVDNTAPTKPSGGAISISGSSTSKSLTAVSGSTDSGSGFKEYRYYVKTSSGAPANTNSNFKTSRTFTRSCGTTYYAYAVAVDNVGNISSVYKIGQASDGADKYNSYGSCSKTCGGGTKTRTNTCALVTTGLSTSCNTQACSKTYDAGDGCKYYAPTTRSLGYSFTCSAGHTHTSGYFVYCRQTTNGNITFKLKAAYWKSLGYSSSSPTLICPQAGASIESTYYRMDSADASLMDNGNIKSTCSDSEKGKGCYPSGSFGS